jgi:hypothetical protein
MDEELPAQAWARLQVGWHLELLVVAPKFLLGVGVLLIAFLLYGYKFIS